MKKGLLLLLLILTSGGYGCATVIHGTTQDIACSSTPAGASVRSADGKQGTTPCTLTLTRKKDNNLTFEKDGYETTTVTMHSVMSGVVAGNIIAGGLIGWGVDAATGAQKRLVPETVDITLKPLLAKLDLAPVGPPPKSALDKLKELGELRKADLISEDEYNRMKEPLLKEYGLADQAAVTDKEE
jgi:hypothetical protein